MNREGIDEKEVRKFYKKIREVKDRPDNIQVVHYDSNVDIFKSSEELKDGKTNEKERKN